MTVFEILVNYEDVWMHSATLQDGRVEVALHFSKGAKHVGDLIVRFPSVDAVRGFIANLELAFVDKKFTVEGEQ